MLSLFKNCCYPSIKPQPNMIPISQGDVFPYYSYWNKEGLKKIEVSHKMEFLKNKFLSPMKLKFYNTNHPSNCPSLCYINTLLNATKYHKDVVISPRDICLIIMFSLASKRNTSEIQKIICDHQNLEEDFLHQSYNILKNNITSQYIPIIEKLSPGDKIDDMIFRFLAVGSMLNTYEINKLYVWNWKCKTGIRYIILDGTVDEWKIVLELAELIKEENEAYSHNLKEIIQKIIDSYQNLDVNWWRSIIHNHDDLISGWITKLYISGKEKNNFKELILPHVLVPFQTNDNTYYFMGGFTDYYDNGDVIRPSTSLTIIENAVS